jgi:DNA polymerase III subunit gamma/tau
MSYEVIARKWRPQKFDDVVGQQAVTRTLRNALASGRLAQSFVFAGPRGVGKTTTARILARALSCTAGPTSDPCGTCEACVEIAGGRDIDVLEIDAATHTGIDNIREVIVSGLSIMPVRDRFKIFIIDEVHQLSPQSFNALLKSIEEPPPHVVFMMATTELEKIPETVLSRSQVYELRPIGTNAIATQLRRIVDAEGIAVGQESLQLIARAAEGSMRDAQSKLDQVIAFTGGTIAAEDVATVLGLVGRDLLLDTLDAVAGEDASASFALVARAMEMGYDLRAVCRELSRVVRDLLVVSVDASRLADPEIAGEGEADRLKALVARFSREDLLRAFDLLTKAEADIRAAAQPRYHLEMALLRWMHLRKLVPIEDLIASAGAADRPSLKPAGPRSSVPRAMPAPPAAASPQAVEARTSAPSDAAGFKDALLAQIKNGKPVFYNMVVAQAQTIEAAADRVTFTFSPHQRALSTTFEQNRAWLESIAQQVAGRRITASCVVAAPAAAAPPAAGMTAAEKKSALRQQALADAGVQTMLEIFPAEIRDVEEM